MIKVIMMLATATLAALLPAQAQAGSVASFTVEKVTGRTAGLDEQNLDAFRARMERALLATKVFEVENRSASDAEIIFRENEYGGNLRGQKGKMADFALKIDIDAFSFERENRRITAMPGKYNAKAIGSIKLRATVLSMHTGKTKKTFTIDQIFEERIGVLDQSEVQQSVPYGSFSFDALVLSAPGTNEDLITLIDACSDMLAERILEDMFPAEVMLVKGDQVYISRGFETGYAVGQTYRILSGDGEELIHPVTGEVLGVAEVHLANVEIIDVRDDFSIGTLTEVKSTVPKGAFVRR